MISPYFLKSVGFAVLIVGLIGDIIVLFLPASRRTLEKTLSVFFILLIIAGVATERVAEHIIDTANGPRHMSSAQWSRFTIALSVFKGQQFAIHEYTDEVEAADLVAHLRSSLTAEGWMYEEPNFGNRFLGSLLGVLLVLNDLSDKKTHDAATKLVSIA